MSDKHIEKHEARLLAVETLYALDFNKQLQEDGEEEMLAFPEETLFYARFLIHGTLDHLEEVDSVISRYSINRPIERINLVDRNILRISVFSLLYCKDLHPSIVIDEAVKLSQALSTDVTYKFINGVLDAVRKNLEK